MKRPIEYYAEHTEDHPMDVTFFVGPEVERTKQYGQATLFKVGEQSEEEIIYWLKMGEERYGSPINHIYFTANHSLRDIKDWSILDRLLTRGYYVTVDGFAEDIHKLNLPYENHQLIVIIGVPILSAEMKQNVYIKVDIEEFGEGNPGVWLTPLKNITKWSEATNFTPWSEYKKDIILK